jgi:hypothetical protein
LKITALHAEAKDLPEVEIKPQPNPLVPHQAQYTPLLYRALIIALEILGMVRSH